MTESTANPHEVAVTLRAHRTTDMVAPPHAGNNTDLVLDSARLQ
jgi:hypothetical protein